MNILFDTSVLVAAFEVSHPRHANCLPWLQQAQSQEIQGWICSHPLAELYAVLPRLPVRPPIAPAIAEQLITLNLPAFEVVLLTREDYQQAIQTMVQRQLPGGGIYDALIAQAAIKAEAERLLTLNPKDFTRFGADFAQRVQVPD